MPRLVCVCTSQSKSTSSDLNLFNLLYVCCSVIIDKINQEGRNGVDAKSDRHKYLCHVESKRSAGLVQEQQQKSSQMYEKQHPNNKIAINRPSILFPNDLTWLSCH